MNEWLFFSHILIMVLFTLLALKLGRTALIATISVEAVIANLLVLKQITLFGLTVTCGDVYIVGSILALNFLQEFYGSAEARKASYAAFLSLALLAISGRIHLIYQPSPYDTLQEAYRQVLGQLPRLVLASFGAYFLSTWVARVSFSALKKSQLPLMVRNSFSIVLSQLVDTVAFAYAGLFGLVSHLWHVILICLCVKAVVICFTAPTNLLASRIKRVA